MHTASTSSGERREEEAGVAQVSYGRGWEEEARRAARQRSPYKDEARGPPLASDQLLFPHSVPAARWNHAQPHQVTASLHYQPSAQSKSIQTLTILFCSKYIFLVNTAIYSMSQSTLPVSTEQTFVTSATNQSQEPTIFINGYQCQHLITQFLFREQMLHITLNRLKD